MKIPSAIEPTSSAAPPGANAGFNDEGETRLSNRRAFDRINKMNKIHSKRFCAFCPKILCVLRACQAVAVRRRLVLRG